MPPEEEISPASEGGAAVEGEQKAAETGAQAPGQGQSPESPQVEGGESQASSNPGQARQNFNWANQRILEKAVTKILSSSLDSRLTPLEQSLKSLLERLPEKPQGQTAQTNEIDYNDLPGSINKMVDTILKQRESISTKKLSDLKGELMNDISTQTSRQEARKYLQSQKDIGTDASKHEEIQDIIVNDEILLSAIDRYPVKVMQQAVERWRASKKNPMAPGKDELSTVAGGMGAARRGQEISPLKVKELTDKVSSANLTIEEREKLNAEISRLVSSMK